MCWSGGETVHIVSLSHLGDTILLVPEPGDPVIRTTRPRIRGAPDRRLGQGSRNGLQVVAQGTSIPWLRDAHGIGLE